MNVNNNHQNANEDYQLRLDEPEVHLRDYLYVILIRKWFVLSGFIAVMSATIYYIVATTPIYEAKVDLLYEKSRSTPILIQGFEVSMNPSSLQLEAQKRILRSPQIIQKVAIRFNALDRDYNLPIEEITESLDISSPPKADDILELSATADSPKKAAALANIATDVYINNLNERKTADLDRAITFLEKQKNTLDGMLQKDEETLHQFREEEGVLIPSPNDSRTGSNLLSYSLLSQLGRLQQNVLDVQMERDLIDIELTTVEEMIDEKEEKLNSDAEAASLISGSMSQIEELQSRIIDMELELDTIREEKSDKHPDVIQLDQKIESAKARLNAELSKLLEGQDLGSLNLISEWQNLINQSVDVTIKFRRFDEQEKLLQSKVDQFKASHPELVDKEVELMRLNRQKRVHTETYSLLMSRYQETLILKEMQTSDLTPITSAEEPESPIKPQKKLALALGVVLGLMLGLGAAFFVEYMDDSLRRQEDIERYLNVPVIGTIPRIDAVYPSLPFPADNVLHNPSNLPELAKDNHGSQSNDNPSGQPANSNPQLVTSKRRHRNRNRSNSKKTLELLARSLIYNKAKDIAESYRSLATNIQFANVDNPSEVILITSPTPSEGKTLTAGNLAVTIAQSDKKTLLVDCDLRRPSQHRLFVQPREPGLSDYLIATPSNELVSEAMNGLVRETEVNNLFLVTCGQVPPNPITLFASEKMKQLIKKWREEYDIILFDSPPILSVADTSILASEVDAVIVVLQAGHTKRQSAQHAIEILEKIDREPFGIVLNNINFSKHYGSYYYYYPREYYTSEEEEDDE